MSLPSYRYTAIPKPATLARDAQAIFEADMAGAELYENTTEGNSMRKKRWYSKNRRRVLAQQKAYRERRKSEGRKA